MAAKLGLIRGRGCAASRRGLPQHCIQRRCVEMATVSQAKREGNMADSFVSLSGASRPPLPDRYRRLKHHLVAGNEAKLAESWRRLLRALSARNREIVRGGPSLIPSVDFPSLGEGIRRHRAAIRKQGCAVVRGVMPPEEARACKERIESYISDNPRRTNAFPRDNPQVWELYWSRPQVEARAHPNMLLAQRALIHVWDAPSEDAAIDAEAPVTYADRLRIRRPGDSTFAPGPHLDGGSVERWDVEGYGRGGSGGEGVYAEVFRGEWEKWQAWNAERRLDVVTDLHDGLGACSAFRMFQGWVSMSWVKPGHGTLLVYPDLRLSMPYILLRPFFRPVVAREEMGGGAAAAAAAAAAEARQKYLDAENWVLLGADDMDSELHGATPGHGQEVTEELHPHLELESTMTHMPRLSPGDFVVWHCDAIHAVDRKHSGTQDSSVLYIPVCPLTRTNAEYLGRQREAFRRGWPSPDFPGGKGESEHVGRTAEGDVRGVIGDEGLRAMGLLGFSKEEGRTRGAIRIRELANHTLGLSEP